MAKKKQSGADNVRNYVAKHARQFNTAAVFTDRKKAALSLLLSSSTNHQTTSKQPHHSRTDQRHLCIYVGTQTIFAP